MRVKITDSESYSELDLIPENAEEAAILLRMAQNTKKVMPDITLHFKKDVHVNVFFVKRNMDKQTHIIRPGR